MQRWWHTLPEETVCRDLNPSNPLFRPNVHLTLSLHLNQVYMGRPFLFHQSKVLTPGTPQSSQSPNWSILATDCVDGALRIIELCELLHLHCGLARASYTEFSSCRAALLAIIAQSLNEQSDRLRIALANGLGMIRRMMVGNDSAKAEVSVIEALATATKRLTSASNETLDTGMGDTASGYDFFKNWAVSFSTGSKDGELLNDLIPHGNDMTGGQSDPFAGMNDVDLNDLLASFPLEQGGFGPLSPFG